MTAASGNSKAAAGWLLLLLLWFLRLLLTLVGCGGRGQFVAVRSGGWGRNAFGNAYPLVL